jgi:hypothetical protein
MHVNIALTDADLDEKTIPMFRRERPRTLPVLFGAATGVVCFVLLLLIAKSVASAEPTDVLVVTVTGEDGRALPETRVFVDGNLRCESSPCRISNLEDGVHFVSASAAGHVTSAPRVVRTSQNEFLALHLALGRGVRF